MAKKTTKKTAKAGSKKTSKKVSKKTVRKTSKKTTKKTAPAAGSRGGVRTTKKTGGRTTKKAPSGGGRRGSSRSRVTRTEIRSIAIDDEDGQRRPSRAPRPARGGLTVPSGPKADRQPKPELRPARRESEGRRPEARSAPAKRDRDERPPKPIEIPSGPRADRERKTDDRDRDGRDRNDRPRGDRDRDNGEARPDDGRRRSDDRGGSRDERGRGSRVGENPKAGGRERSQTKPRGNPGNNPGSTPRSKPADDAERDETIFDDTVTFEDFDLVEDVLDGVEEEGFVHPTVIQAMLIPPALEGKDVLGQAKTGTGKTAAFGLPLLSLVDPGDAFAGLVLAPTRELALQITAELETLGKYSDLNVVTVYGGDPIEKQAKRLAKKPEIIVGTPGRVMDMERRGYLRFDRVQVAILDEVDRMLDIGFREDIRKILGACPKDRQTIFVSATLTEEIEKLARRYMRDPEKLVASAGSLTVSVVEQHYISVQPWDKKRLLLHLLTHEEPALTVVFCRLKRVVDDLEKHLRDHKIDAVAIHGDMRQSRRNSVMQRLRSGELAVLIASDLASRGIDVEGISHVINYDLPEDPDLYIHRIGRTARAGRGGIAWSLVTPEQGKLLTEIENRANAHIPPMSYPDFEPGPEPRQVREQRQEAERRDEQLRRKALERQGAVLPTEASEDKFPGGVVPTKLPPRRLGGRVARRR
ncbi:MAG: DEAD/DEAH box helicase [Planctomycetota bacterium]